MAQAQGSEARLIVGSELVYKATPVLVIEDCEDAWNELVDADVTATLEAAIYKKGAGSCKLVVAAGASAGDILATEAFAAKDLSPYTHIGFWIRSSVALAAGDLQILLDDTANCASPIETLDVPAVATVDTWQFCKVALATPASCTAIISVGLKMVVDKAGFTVYLDAIEALNQARIIPFVSESLRMSRNLITSNALRTSRQPQAPTRGNKDVAGEVPLEMNPYLQFLFYHLFGGWSVAGANPYTHTFTIGSLPTGVVIEKQFPDIVQYFRYNGCKINSFSLAIKAEGPITGSFNFMGAKETIDTLPFDSSPLDYGHTPFDGFEAVINQGGSALGIVTELDLTMENNLDGSVFVIGGAGERYSMPAGKVKVSGTLKALFENTTLYTLALNHTETSLQIVLTKGVGDGTVGDEKLTIDMDEVVFAPNAPVISGPMGVMVELPFEAYYDNDADASAIRITLLNTASGL